MKDNICHNKEKSFKQNQAMSLIIRQKTTTQLRNALTKWTTAKFQDGLKKKLVIPLKIKG